VSQHLKTRMLIGAAGFFLASHRQLAVKKCAPRAPGACFNRLSHRCEGLSITKAHRARWHQKRYFQRTCRCGLNRACPTNGSDRGSLRDHNLTLLVSRLPHLYDQLLLFQIAIPQ